MPHLRAYLESLRHQHEWHPLNEEAEWCPGCGSIRQRPEADEGDE